MNICLPFFHPYGVWEHHRTVYYYEYPEQKIPVDTREVYMRTCTRCGKPQSRKVSI